MSVRSSRSSANEPGTQIVVAGVSLEAVPRRAGRDTLFLVNADSAGWVYVVLGDELPAALGDGIPLAPGGGSLVLEGYTGPAQAISDDPLGTILSVTEL